MSQSGTAADGTGGRLGNAGGIEDRPNAGIPGVNIYPICNAQFRTLENYQHHVLAQHPGTTEAYAASARTSATGLKAKTE
ncbi:MAG: hypothetical protein M3258_01430 [Thermoproteota archaeon]|nr:hypothetical protein [Thermoproteota archaeon]